MHQNTKGQRSWVGAFFPLVPPPNASHHTAALLRVRCHGALGALVKKQRELKPPIGLVSAGRPAVQEDGGFTLHREGGAALPYVRLGLR